MGSARRRWANLPAILALAATAVTSAGVALAQQPAPPPPAAPTVSDADRLNAREQFASGIEAQQQGRWADALLAFQRAQALFSAPTNMLHMAECMAQLGRLVEAEETYRGLTLLVLPKDSPAPFFAAQAQGAAELQQIQARIPKMRIEVTPANLPNLVVTLDQQAFNAVLLGADRSVDPGAHTVTAFAPGYGQKEVKVVVHEKEPTKVVTVELQPSGVVYTPIAQAPQNLAPLPPAVGPAPPYYTQQQQPLPPARGAEAPPYTPPPPKPKPPGASWLLGVRAGINLMGGGLLPTNSNANASNTNSISLSDAFATGGVFGLQGGIRFARNFYAGVIYEHTFAGGGGNTTSLPNYYTGQQTGFGPNGTSVSTYGNMIAADLGYISNPDGVGIVLDVAAAYRVIGLTTSNNAFSASYNGPEIILGGGIWIAAGPNVRIVPRLDLGIGSFGGEGVSVQCPTGGCSNSTTSIANAPTHVIAFLGLGGYWNLNLCHKEPQPPR